MTEIMYAIPAKADNLRVFVGWSDERVTYFMKVILLTPYQEVQEHQVDEVGYDGDTIHGIGTLNVHARQYTKDPCGIPFAIDMQLLAAKLRFDEGVAHVLED